MTISNETLIKREELKRQIIDLDILQINHLNQIRVNKRNLKPILTQIIESTPKCRDSIPERVFWIVNDIFDYPCCSVCGKQFQPRFYGFTTTKPFSDLIFCSTKCAGPTIYANGSKTNLIRYGTENVFASEFGKNKVKQSHLKNSGYENPFQNPQIIQKINDDREERTGYRNCSQDPLIKEKKKETNIEKFGVPFAIQNPECFEKAQKTANKYKRHTFPDGTEILYMGYELVAIHKLLEVNALNQIKTQRSEIPTIKYYHNQSRTYYPDIFIPHLNLIIEVKSTWTYGSETKNIEDFYLNQIKRRACLDAGYNFQFWICSNKEVLEII